MAYTGSTPINLSFDAIQATSVKGLGVFKIGHDMKLSISNRNYNLPMIFLDMGNDVTNKYVIEYTIIPIDKIHFKVIVKNSDGIARYITIYNSFKLPTYDKVLTNVIKVAGGKILYEDKDKYVVNNGKYLQLGTDNTIDIIPDGNGGLKKIKVDNADAKIQTVLDNFTLTTDGILMNGTTQIGSNIISIGSFTVGDIKGFLVGKLGSVNDSIKSQAHAVFYEAGVEDSWHDAYETFIESKDKPLCEWAGAGVQVTHTKTLSFSECFNKTKSKTIPHYYFAVSEDGKTYRVDDNALKDINVVYPDADGFNALYGNDSIEPILFDHIVGGQYLKSFWFEEPELSEPYRSNLILRR